MAMRSYEAIKTTCLQGWPWLQSNTRGNNPRHNSVIYAATVRHRFSLLPRGKRQRRGKLDNLNVFASSGKHRGTFLAVSPEKACGESRGGVCSDCGR
jgi:hypothetical protein